MIYGIDIYEEFILSILKRIPILRTKQLLIALQKYYEDMSDKLASDILFGLQRKRVIMLSETGWVMTQGMYYRLTNDKFNDGATFRTTYHIPKEIGIYGNIHETNNKLTWGRIRTSTIEDELDQHTKNYVNCMWLVVDMLPDSEDFFVANPPWNIAFDTSSSDPENSKLFLISMVPSSGETTKCEAFRNLPKINDEKLRNSIRRIAIMEDPNHYWKIPHLGFSHVVALDENMQTNYRIIEARLKDNPKEVWKDYGEK